MFLAQEQGWSSKDGKGKKETKKKKRKKNSFLIELEEKP